MANTRYKQSAGNAALVERSSRGCPNAGVTMDVPGPSQARASLSRTDRGNHVSHFIIPNSRRSMQCEPG